LIQFGLTMHGENSYNPLVSVIIPNYNHAPFLKERIDSVLNQTYRNFEVILLDDFSTDSSREIIESYRGHEKISHIEYNTTNSGSTFKQWEKGIIIAKGEWIWIAESDDLAHPDILLKCLASAQEVDMVFCKSIIINGLGERASFLGESFFPTEEVFPSNKPYYRIDSTKFLEERMFNFNHIVNASSVLTKRASLYQWIPSITDFKLCGDWMLWVIMLTHGKVSYLNEGLNYFRVHDQTVRASESNTMATLYENARIAAYIFRNRPTPVLKRKISEYLIFAYFHRYSNAQRKGTFLSFLNLISMYGLKAVIHTLSHKLRHD
jgi:glycosyltransferase involved in cell wall biosynthesis